MSIDIEDLFRYHMGSCIYKTSCTECGSSVNVEISHIHGDGDIDLEITPCGCIKEENNE